MPKINARLALLIGVPIALVLLLFALLVSCGDDDSGSHPGGYHPGYHPAATAPSYHAPAGVRPSKASLVDKAKRQLTKPRSGGGSRPKSFRVRGRR